MTAGDDIARLMEPVARVLLGEPNRRLSSAHELRFGNHGSIAVKPDKGAWYDHENQRGGGVLDLIRAVTGRDVPGCFNWLNEHGMELQEARAQPRKGNGRAQLGDIVATYPYVDEHNALLFQVCRFDPKDFRQRRPDPGALGGFSWGTRGVRQIPYRLPELIEDLAQERPVLIVEGEKDVDNLRRGGVPATCNAGGAGKWKSELNVHLRNADVVLLPDNDDAGRKHVEMIKEQLEGTASRIRILDLARYWQDMPHKADVSDWLQKGGGTIEKLYALLDRLDANGAGRSSAMSLAEVITIFRRWLDLRDPMVVYVILGTVAANLQDGDPVWLGIIAPPSSAKTEILNTLSHLPYVEPTATLTLAALLSGTPKRDLAANAKGGLLRKVGKFGILVLKDFGSILSMRPDTKAEVIAALREIYDGAWTRHIGTEGGRTLKWEGKIGFLFGSTESYDDHHSITAGLGERFLLYRGLAPSGDLNKALDHSGAAVRAMRDELAESVTSLLGNVGKSAGGLHEHEKDRLKDIVKLAVRLRAHVNRDHYSREILSIHEPEGIGRLAICLERLFSGLIAIGLDRERAMRVIETVALDSAPPLRRHAFEELTTVPRATRDIAKKFKLPTVTMRRTLEDLEAQGLAKRERAKDEDSGEEKKGGADLWSVDPQWKEWISQSDEVEAGKWSEASESQADEY